MDIAQASIMYHVALVLLLLWVLVSYGWCHPIIFFVSLLYLYKVNEYCSLRFRKRLQFEERKNAYQRRLLSDSESVRWLNRAVEKVWPICLERIASQQFLLPIIPWFLDKYKPWTARKAVVQQLYLGRNPPMFTEIRVLGESADDDHLVLELGMNFLSADDMSAILAVQLRKRLGFGMWAKMHITGMHVEGKVLVGVKFLRQWPFLGRLRVCFVEPPYFNMTVKPIFSHGIDVTELPGIAGWLEKILDVAFEQTLVEPNMLVVDVEKFASAPTESWFTVDEKPPVAIVRLEILEAADMKPSDLNGLADPYVKGQLGPYRFQTKIQRKTLAPKWLEEFKIPIVSWEARNVLVLEVHDKDTIFDDMLGDCSINIGELKGGQRHDKWLPLKNIKMGRLHVAVTIMESEGVKVEHFIDDEEPPPMSETTTTKSSSVDQNYTRPDAPLDEGHKLANQYEPINIEGQEKTGIWVHRPGSDVSQTWEQREGRQRYPEVLVHRVQNECTDSSRSVACGSNQSEDNCDDEDVDTGSNGLQRFGTIKKGLNKIGSLFNRSPKSPHSTPKGSSPREFGKDAIPTSHPDTQAVSEKASTVKLVVDDVSVESSGNQKIDVNSCVLEKNEAKNPGNSNVSGMAENSVKQGGKSAYSLRSVPSRKGSKKRNEDQSEKAEGNGSKALDQSNDEDYPLVVGGTPIEVLPASDNNKESINFREVSAEENVELGNVGSIGT